MQQNDVDPPEVVLLEEAVALLPQLTDWVRVLACSSAKETLSHVLDSPEKRAVYEAIGGQCGVREIGAKTGVSRSLVSSWGKEWERLGIVVQSPASGIKGRREKQFDLALFGLAAGNLHAANEMEE